MRRKNRLMTTGTEFNRIVILYMISNLFLINKDFIAYFC